MEVRMSGRIRFQYRPLYDVVIAYVDWHIETEEDLLAWCREYDTYFKGRFPRKVDLILELSKFHLNPRVAPQFGTHRARILGEFTNRSYRVKQAAKERAFMHTAHVLKGGPANHFETIDDALKALLGDRAKESEETTKRKSTGRIRAK
jgi:hypothetical protein